MNRVFAAPSADPSRSSVRCRFCKQLEITELIRIELIKTPTTKEPEHAECDLGERGAAERWAPGAGLAVLPEPTGAGRKLLGGSADSLLASARPLSPHFCTLGLEKRRLCPFCPSCSICRDGSLDPVECLR